MKLTIVLGIEFLLFYTLIYVLNKRIDKLLIKKSGIRNLSYKHIFGDGSNRFDYSWLYYFLLIILSILIKNYVEKYLYVLGLIFIYLYYLLLKEKSRLVKQIGLSFSDKEYYFLSTYILNSTIFGLLWIILHGVVLYFYDYFISIYVMVENSNYVIVTFSIIFAGYLFLFFTPQLQLMFLKKNILDSDLSYVGNVKSTVLFMDTLEISEKGEVLKSFLTKEEEEKLDEFSYTTQNRILIEFEKEILGSKLNRMYINLLRRFF